MTILQNTLPLNYRDQNKESLLKTVKNYDKANKNRKPTKVSPVPTTFAPHPLSLCDTSISTEVTDNIPKGNKEPLLVTKEQTIPETKEQKIETSKFRLNAKKLFLTFPQIHNDYTHDNIYENLQENEKNLKSVIIAKETHKDGGFHFHIFLEYENKVDIRRHDHYDYIFHKHGQYSTVKSMKQTIKYITKENNFKEFLTHYTEEKITNLTKVRSLLEHPKARTFDPLKLTKEDERNFIFNLGTKIENYYKRHQAFLHEQETATKKHILTWDLDLLKKQMNDSNRLYLNNLLPILHFLNRHMQKNNRRYKSPNLLIWSHEPNFGKSSLFNLIKAHSPTYQWPTDNWYELYSNFLIQFIIWDEFTLIGHSQEFMKLLLTGEPLKLPIKGSQIFKKDNPLILCGSNYSLREHVIRKYSVVCHCHIEPRTPLLESPLCRKGPTCNTPLNAILYYNALCARILEIPLNGPISPDGSAFPEDWEAYWKLVLSAAVLHTAPGEPEIPPTPLPPLNDWVKVFKDLYAKCSEPPLFPGMLTVPPKIFGPD